MANYTDIQDVIDKLNKVGKDIEPAVKRAVERGAEVSEKVLQKNTPKSIVNKPHLKNTIVKSKFKDNKIDVGFNAETYWYAHMVEFGTIHQRPQGFMQKTIAQVQEPVIDAMMEELKEVLGE